MSYVKIVTMQDASKYLHIFHPDCGEDGEWVKVGEHALCYQKGMSGEDMFHQLMRSCEKGDYTYDAETHTIMSGDKPVVKAACDSTT